MLGYSLKIANCDDGNFSYGEQGAIRLKQRGIHLEIRVDDEELRYAYSLDGKHWHKIGTVYDASILSDEYGRISHFTGAFIGICIRDLSGTSLDDDFDYFEYKENP